MIAAQQSAQQPVQQPAQPVETGVEGGDIVAISEPGEPVNDGVLDTQDPNETVGV